VALRRLRAFVREGALEELDVERTIVVPGRIVNIITR